MTFKEYKGLDLTAADAQVLDLTEAEIRELNIPESLVNEVLEMIDEANGNNI